MSASVKLLDKLEGVENLLICVPWEVFPMCYSFLSTCGRDICLCPMYFMFYFVLDFG
jgi:hypothetical protein